MATIRVVLTQSICMKSDRLFAEPLASVSDFQFDARVADVFTDMIRRSVPGYSELLPLLSVLGGEYARPQTFCYDLGCSLGAASLALASRLPPDCRILAVDNAPAMIQACREQLARAGFAERIETRCTDIRDVAITNASVVMLNFTLQFIPLAERLPLLQRIRAGMVDDGVLILSEKLAFAAPAEQQWHERMHAAFKRANGYSDLEISQKRAALERVLLPETLDAHRQRLEVAGFTQVWSWFQNLNFVSLVALP